eukprot:INCI5074.4.p2 GENE.INCI5074.4~~INCI5074.4.p2  ORF type:complete len:400 (+),score=53.76 INCI5074.4:110-1309(+)
MECAAVGDFRRVRASLKGLEREVHATLHRAICDACGSLILGTRFCCADCADFDLCRGCLGCPEDHFARIAQDSPSLWADAGSIHTRRHRLLILNRIDEERGQWAVHAKLLQRLGEGSSRSVEPRPKQPNTFQCGVQQSGAPVETPDSAEADVERGSNTRSPAEASRVVDGPHVTIRALRRIDMAALVAIENICFLQPYPRSAFERALVPRTDPEDEDGTIDCDEMCMDEDFAFRRCACFVAIVGEQHAPDGVPEATRGQGPMRNALLQQSLAMTLNRGEAVVAGYILLVNAGRKTAQIASIATRPDCRGRGVASTLLRHAMHVASRAGSSWCDLHVHIANTGAQRLYTHLGFRRVQKLREYYGPCEDGMQQSGDAFLMRRQLSPVCMDVEVPAKLSIRK